MQRNCTLPILSNSLQTVKALLYTFTVIKGNIKTENESVHEKTINLGSDQVRHKPGCTVTEDGKRLEILDLESRGIVLCM